MAKYNIPPPFKIGFTHLSKFSKEHLDIILNILKEVEFGISPDKIIEQILTYNIEEKEKIVEVVKAILSLVALKNDENVKVSELVNDLTTDFKEDNPDISEDRVNNLSINLHEILNINSKINHTLKAFDLLAENEKIFLESRILSDIRIVFDDDLSKEINAHGTIVLHQLKISYRENQESKSIFFALDINDLNNLKEQVERAIQKHRIIENKTFSNLPFIKTEKNKDE